LLPRRKARFNGKAPVSDLERLELALGEFQHEVDELHRLVQVMVAARVSPPPEQEEAAGRDDDELASA